MVRKDLVLDLGTANTEWHRDNENTDEKKPELITT